MQCSEQSVIRGRSRATSSNASRGDDKGGILWINKQIKSFTSPVLCHTIEIYMLILKSVYACCFLVTRLFS